MEITISRENPYRDSVFSQIGPKNSIWFRGIRISLAYDYTRDCYHKDRYDLSYRSGYLTSTNFDEEDATRILILLNLIGYEQ